MARSQYQYTPVVGPVWRAAVAASLAWLPAGNAQPARQLPPQRPGDYVEPFVEAINVARNLQWVPSGRAPVRLEVRRYDWTVLAPFQPAAAGFDPALFPWDASYRVRSPERRLVGDFAESFFQALYKPEGLQWIPAGWCQPQRGLVRGTPTWVILDPFPIVSAFDPALLAWLPSARPYPRALPNGTLLERYVIVVPPLVLYNPARLQWLPYVPFPQRRLEVGRLGWIVLDPLERTGSTVSLPGIWAGPTVPGIGYWPGR